MKAIITSIAVLVGIAAAAQDTTGKKVKITSSFKPVLKEAAKINLAASPALNDTSRPRLQYSIPTQSQNFAFQPGALRPLALSVDTGGNWTNESYVKAGFGNFRTPFVQLGVSVGNGKASGINLYGKHVSSKGRLPFQDFSNTQAELNAFLRSSNIEWNVRFGALQEKYNKYGFVPATVVFPDDSINVKFETYRGRLAFRNVARTEFGISYAPEIKFDGFSDRLGNNERNTYFNLPVQKYLTKEFGVDVALSGSVSRYKPDGKTTVNNNWVAISPSLLYKTATVSLQAGLRPAWDNSVFKLFPNVMAEVSAPAQRFSFKAGWVGFLRNVGYQYQARINPWIWAPATVYNAQVEERYAGIKGSAGDHFSYSAKAAFNTVRNQPLFTNDTTAGGKSFRVINEPRLNVVNLGGELGYTVGEKFSLISNLQINQYNPQVADKAWALLPLEFRTTAKLQIIKDLYFNSELFMFDGPLYQTKGGGRGNLGTAADLSAGLEFKVVQHVKIWAQFNNIFNREYQRWSQYPVYGFNFIGGVVFSFAQEK